MLQICIGSICLVSATPPTVLGQSFWNFTGTLQLSFDFTWEICHLLDITAVAGYLAWLAVLFSVAIDPILFKLAGNEDMHNIMNEFEFRPDRTTDYGVSCPWASKKYPYRPYNGENGVSTFSLLFLIGSFWYFHVTRTSIKAWMSSNFLKWDLTLAHWTQVSDRCPLGYLFESSFTLDNCLASHSNPATLDGISNNMHNTTY